MLGPRQGGELSLSLSFCVSECAPQEQGQDDAPLKLLTVGAPHGANKDHFTKGGPVSNFISFSEILVQIFVSTLNLLSFLLLYISMTSNYLRLPFMSLVPRKLTKLHCISP